MKYQKIKSALSLLLIVCLLIFSSVYVVQGAEAKINKKKITLFVGQAKKLNISNTKKKIKWSSTNKEVATVTKTGIVKGVNHGTTIINAKVGSKKYSCNVVVKKVLTSDSTLLKFSKLNTKKSFRITMLANSTVKYKIKNERIITCSWGKWDGNDVKLYVQAKENGTTNIVISNDFNNEKLNIKVVVHEPTEEEIIAQKEANLTLDFSNELPVKLYNYNYDGSTKQTYMLEDITYDVTYYKYSDEYKLDVYFTGNKLYDYRGSNQSNRLQISWKLYQDDYVVDSGTVYTASLAEGERFKDEKASIYLKNSGKYTLSISSTN